MSSTSSPHHEVTDLMRRRNLTNIPRDQLNLLEASESWVGDVKQQPDARTHVPSHVLESVKAAYLAQRKPSKKPATSTELGDPGEPNNSSAPSNGDAARHAVQSQIPPSSPERPISWPPSPPRDLDRDQAAVDSQIISETPKAPPKVILENPPSSMPAPPQPLSVSSRPIASIEYPSSGSEEDLEMELPQAQARPDAPINLQATVASPISSGRKPMDTPPCAQRTQGIHPVVPNTVMQEPREAGPEKKRRWEAIDFSQNAIKNVQPTKIRLAPAKDFNQAQVISSNSTSSSSVIPATNPIYDPITSSIENARGGYELGTPSEEQPLQVVFSKPRKSATESRPRRLTRSHSTLNILESNDPPYEVFLQAYPTYEEHHQGGEYEFIYAVYALQFIRKRRALREFLYDEFIRVFPDYPLYFHDAKPNQEPLPVIEWFNIKSEAPEFGRMIVSPKNLRFILEKYPDLTAKAKQVFNPRLLFGGTVFQAELPEAALVSPPARILSAAQSPASVARSSGSTRKTPTVPLLENLTKPIPTPARELPRQLENSTKPMYTPAKEQPRPRASGLETLTKPTYTPAREQSRAVASLPSTSVARRRESSVASPTLSERPHQAPPSSSSNGFEATSIAPFSSYPHKRHTIGGSMAPPPAKRSRASSMAPLANKRSRASSMAPTPSIAGSTTSRKSGYLDSLGTRSRDKTASRRRSMEERAQLRERLRQESAELRSSSTAL